MECTGHTRLLQLERSFHLSCLAVRQSGKELAEMKNYLLKELLSIATLRSERTAREQQVAEEEIRRLQEHSERQEVEVSRLHELLQTTQPTAPGGVPLEEPRDERADSGGGDSDHMSTSSTVPHSRCGTRKSGRAKSTGSHYKKARKKETAEDTSSSGTGLGQVIPSAPSASLRSVDVEVDSSQECQVVTTTEDCTPTTRASDHEPSPEIPLQSQRKRVSSPTSPPPDSMPDSLTQVEGTKLKGTKQCEEVGTSEWVEERSSKCRESDLTAGERHSAGVSTSMMKGAGRRRTTLLSRKSQVSHLSVVEEVPQGRRLAIKVNTHGFTAPKLKTDTHSD